MTAADSITRSDQVRLLLGSLYDYLPGPKVASYGAADRPAATSETPCTACAGTGTLGRKTPRECGACSGKGTIAVDPYTGEAALAHRATAADSKRIDAELRRLERDAEHRRGRHLDDRFAWEAERVRYRRAGSYASLEDALDAMRANLPDTYSLVLRCLVHGASEPTGDAETALGRAVDWLANRMPPVIHVPRWLTETPEQPVREWKPGPTDGNTVVKDRNARIIKLRGDGWTQARIAQEVGVGVATVSRVLSAVKEAA